MGKEEIVSDEEMIEAGRKILYHAADMNMNREILIKISQKVDKYIVKYLQRGIVKKE
ncbi:MAG: Spo0E family sporulation regulatory protein-aspartic acid phosphatase [Peptococcia bacterium]